jgi:hypothetical protein
MWVPLDGYHVALALSGIWWGSAVFELNSIRHSNLVRVGLYYNWYFGRYAVDRPRIGPLWLAVVGLLIVIVPRLTCCLMIPQALDFMWTRLHRPTLPDRLRRQNFKATTKRLSADEVLEMIEDLAPLYALDINTIRQRLRRDFEVDFIDHSAHYQFWPDNGKIVVNCSYEFDLGCTSTSEHEYKHRGNDIFARTTKDTFVSYGSERTDIEEGSIADGESVTEVDPDERERLQREIEWHVINDDDHLWFAIIYMKGGQHIETALGRLEQRKTRVEEGLSRFQSAILANGLEVKPYKYGISILKTPEIMKMSEQMQDDACARATEEAERVSGITTKEFSNHKAILANDETWRQLLQSALAVQKLLS